MIIGVPKEISDGENRVAAIPATVKEYTKKGIDVLVEFGAGDRPNRVGLLATISVYPSTTQFQFCCDRISCEYLNNFDDYY